MIVMYPADGVVADVKNPDATLLDISLANQIPHYRECGGQGRCTTCRVRILDGIDRVSPPTLREARIAEERGWDGFTRLACQTRVRGDVQVQRLISSPADVSIIQTETSLAEPGREALVAILVCDIRRFTPFVAGHLPYDVFHILNRFFGELGEPILLNGGFIYQYVGDQIVALFGLDRASPAESCLNAVRAGLGMITALKTLNTKIKAEFGVELAIRIGAHVGPLILGHLGHPSQRHFSVVGDAMNVASRIEGANERLGTTFVVSEALYDQLQAPVREGRRARLPLKGMAEAQTLVEVLGFAQPDPESLVQETAHRLLGDADRFGEVFYRRLFEIAPGIRHLFSGTMEAQGRMITQMLQVAVYGLARFHAITPGLVALGRRHVQYGVRVEHYGVFRDVFLDTVRELLGEDGTEQIVTAWTTAIDRVLDAVCRGAATAPISLPPSTSHLALITPQAACCPAA